VFLRGNKLLRYLALLAVIPMFFGQPYMTMLAVFARDVLKIGPAGLGLLTSTAALGAITGALVVAGRRKAPRISVMLCEIMVFGLALLMFSLSRWVSVSLFFLFLAGAGNIAYNATNSTLLQLNVPDRYRGRVLSVLLINRGIIPLGTATAGLLAEKFSAPTAQGAMAVALIMLGIMAYFSRPKMSSLQSRSTG
ncbi:MAG: MFS transporter, partial [Syntrophales bacterium LBB04]|nr:MFS transporter [Syntrophales bacterium LBB04]